MEGKGPCSKVLGGIDAPVLTHAIVETAKAIGGSFKLITLAPKNRKGDDATAQGNIKEWRYTNKSTSTNEHTKHKPRLNMQKKHSAQPGCMNWSCAHGKLQMYSLNARDHFNCSPLMTSTTKQMRPNGKGRYFHDTSYNGWPIV